MRAPLPWNTPRLARVRAQYLTPTLIVDATRESRHAVPRTPTLILKLIARCTRRVLLLKVSMRNFFNFGSQNMCGKLANPLGESQKNTSIFEFTHAWPAGRPATGLTHSKQSILTRFS